MHACVLIFTTDTQAQAVAAVSTQELGQTRTIQQVFCQIKSALIMLL